MRIPFIFLILCLIVVYGACPTYGAETGNVDKEKQDFAGVILGLLNDKCPKEEKLSYDLDQFIFFPLQTIRNVICYIIKLVTGGLTSAGFPHLPGLGGLNTMLKN